MFRVSSAITGVLDFRILGIYCNYENLVYFYCLIGCRFCQAAKESMIRLGHIVPVNTLDIVTVNVRHPDVPSTLSVPWTPFIR
jgi:hypothetical protein